MIRPVTMYCVDPSVGGVSDPGHRVSRSRLWAAIVGSDAFAD